MQEHEPRCQAGEAEILPSGDVDNKIEEIIIDTFTDKDCYGNTARPQALRNDHGRMPYHDPNSNTPDDRAKLAIAVFEPLFDGFDLHGFAFNVPGEFDSLAVGFSAVRTAEALRMANPVLTPDDTKMDIDAMERSFTTQNRPCDLESLQAARDWTVALNPPQWAVPLDMHLPSEIHHQDLHAGQETPWGCHAMQAQVYWSRAAEQSRYPQSAAIDNTWGAVVHFASV